MTIDYSASLEGIDWAALIASLAADRFDNGRTARQMEASFRNSYRCVIARDGATIVGTGRALSDGVCNAYIVDVWTQSAYRRRGIGRRVVDMLCQALPGQHVNYGQLDLEPRVELAPLRPHRPHLRARIALDHADRMRAASTAAFLGLSTPTAATGTPGGI